MLGIVQIPFITSVDSGEITSFTVEHISNATIRYLYVVPFASALLSSLVVYTVVALSTAPRATHVAPIESYCSILYPPRLWEPCASQERDTLPLASRSSGSVLVTVGAVPIRAKGAQLPFITVSLLALGALSVVSVAGSHLSTTVT